MQPLNKPQVLLSVLSAPGLCVWVGGGVILADIRTSMMDVVDFTQVRLGFQTPTVAKFATIDMYVPPSVCI